MSHIDLFKAMPPVLRHVIIDQFDYVFDNGELHFIKPGFTINNRKFFKQFKGLKSVTGFPVLVGDMSCAFRYRGLLTLVEVNVENVTLRFRMFDGCKSLKSVRLSTENVGHMRGMFLYCTMLTSVNVNAETVTSMKYMVKGFARVEH
jgi:hypothetical protein